MAKESDLLSLMTSRRKAWSPDEICREMGISVFELVRIISKARNDGRISFDSCGTTGFTNKAWLG